MRILNCQDANAFRTVRLEALKNEGEWFGPTYENESKLTEEEWAERCRETPEKAVFGLFHVPNLSGIMQACKYEEDSTGKTTLWGAAYMRPEYRHQGLAKDFYQARMKWTQHRPVYERAVLFIRDGNEHSTAIHLKHGAKFIFTREIKWADRPAVPWHFYEVPIAKTS